MPQMDALPQQILHSRNISASQSARHSTNADHVRDHSADNQVDDVPTFSSDQIVAHDNDGNIDGNALSSNKTKASRSSNRFLKRFSSTTPPTESSTEHGSTRNKAKSYAWDEFREELETLVYIGVFAILGTVLRVYMGRFFGLDCSNPTQDFLTPLSSRICVTNSGKTSYPGGAMFTDLPANMLGSLIMGLVSPIDAGHPIAWFRRDHPLQRHVGFRQGLGTGFCGSLTTFASWNTQMVVMLDGTGTSYGPQIASALFGYLIGAMVAVCCFIFGRHVHSWWLLIHPDQSSEDRDYDEEDGNNTQDDAAQHWSVSQNSDGCKQRTCFFCSLPVASFWVISGLFAAFAVGDAYYHMLFYRKMWMSSLLAPLGAITRYKLKKYNDRKGPWKHLEFMPWGTLMANLLASCISVTAEALSGLFALPGDAGHSWVSTSLSAVEAGYSGSLSTVSTWVKELVDMKQPHWIYIYYLGTILPAMLIGLAIYSPIIRYG